LHSFPTRRSSDLHLRTGFATGNIGNQFVAIFDRLSVNRKYRVAYLQSGTLSRAARDDARNRNTALTTINPRNGRILLRIEFNPNRAALHSVLGTRELVVNLCDGI